MNAIKTKINCPECNQKTTGKFCFCGWREGELLEHQIIDHRCRYEIKSRRCPLPGTNSSSLYGQAVWYCVEHCRNLNNSKLCEEILINAEMNYEKIIENNTDWRRKLFAEDFIITKSTRKKEIA